jgi:hypothetical protein
VDGHPGELTICCVDAKLGKTDDAIGSIDLKWTNVVVALAGTE